LTGKVIHVGADAIDAARPNTSSNPSGNANSSDLSTTTTSATYKARVQLDSQLLNDPQGNKLPLAPGMQVVAEINQGKRSVLEYLLSPVQKAVQEAGRER
jgi:HlyD family secretion protein